MSTKALVLALLLAVAAGCSSRGDREKESQGFESLMGLFVPREEVAGHPEHDHVVGCGHALRGCVWVDEY